MGALIRPNSLHVSDIQAGVFDALITEHHPRYSATLT